MSSYNFFATLYDVLTENVDYKVRSEYISDFFKEEGITSGTIADLACGTCSISIPLAKLGYSVIGIDMSQDMLTVAYNKICDENLDMRLVNAKMQNFVSQEALDGCICSLDSINHLTDANDILKTFENVYNSLKVGGLFIFDVNTIYKHQEVLADNTFIFDEDDYYLVWDNELLYNNEVRIILDFFTKNGDMYERHSEEFNERAYPADELTEMLKKAGFDEIKIYDELSLECPKDDSERIYFVCKKVK